MDNNMGVVTGRPPSSGYGHGADAFRDQLVQSTFYPPVPYPAQLYGYQDEADLRGLGDLTSVLQTLTSDAQGVASDIEAVTGEAAKVTGAVSTGAAAASSALAAPAIAGLSSTSILALGGAALLFFFMSRKR